MVIGKALYKIVCNLNQNGFFTVNSSPYAKEVYERLVFALSGNEQLVNGIRFF